MKNDFKLGSRLRCKVTGWQGIAVARLEYLNGCVQFGIKSQELDKDGKIKDTAYIDSQQLEFVDAGISVQPEPTGGPSPDEPKETRGPQ